MFDKRITLCRRRIGEQQRPADAASSPAAGRQARGAVQYKAEPVKRQRRPLHCGRSFKDSAARPFAARGHVQPWEDVA